MKFHKYKKCFESATNKKGHPEGQPYTYLVG